MIFGIGTDIVDFARIETMWAHYGVRFAERLLSEREMPEFQVQVQPARYLAKRFAAKEAFDKAVGSGLRYPVTLHRICITHDGLGKPMLQFDATLQSYLAKLGVSGHHLSISDERSMIIAFVVLESM